MKATDYGRAVMVNNPDGTRHYHYPEEPREVEMFTLSRSMPPEKPAKVPQAKEKQKLLLVDMNDLPGQTSFFNLNGDTP